MALINRIGSCIMHLCYHGRGWRLFSNVCMCIQIIDPEQMWATIVAVVRTKRSMSRHHYL